MHKAMITLKHKHRRLSEKLVNAALELPGLYLKNGQILPHSTIAHDLSGSIVFHAILPEPDSLDARHTNDWTRAHLAELRKLGFYRPMIRILGRQSAIEDVDPCPQPESYILYTTFLTVVPPLLCGTCFRSIPLYKIPHTYQGEYGDILQWESMAQACDTLFMKGGAATERFAEHQMSDLTSDLAQSGLALCQKIRELTEKPAYYFLFRYHGRDPIKERDRLCPRCNSPWLLDERWHLFDFKCDRCHLLSVMAVDFPDVNSE